MRATLATDEMPRIPAGPHLGAGAEKATPPVSLVDVGLNLNELTSRLDSIGGSLAVAVSNLGGAFPVQGMDAINASREPNGMVETLAARVRYAHALAANIEDSLAALTRALGN